MSDDDRGLRELFARLRAEERADVPSFRAPARRAKSRPVRFAQVAVAAAIVLIALVLARLDHPPQTSSHQVVDLGDAVWRSPTDFLLVTPGSELMRTVPAVGSPNHWGIDLPSRSPAPESTRS
jgi:hypothetical protein